MGEKTVTEADPAAADTEPGPRGRIVRAAAGLLADGGREAVSTRAVAAAAGVQAPTIYRQFGDMRGLLDEVASFGFSTYLREKTTRERRADPVEDLRVGWDLHVEFGLTNPALFTLMYGEPNPGEHPAAARASFDILVELVHRVAVAGRLRVGVERAARMVHAASTGVVLALIAAEPGDRDPGLSGATREAILAAVIAGAASEAEAEAERDGLDRVSRHAVALKATLPEAPPRFTPGERIVLSEWLDRLVDRPG